MDLQGFINSISPQTERTQRTNILNEFFKAVSKEAKVELKTIHATDERTAYVGKLNGNFAKIGADYTPLLTTMERGVFFDTLKKNMSAVVEMLEEEE